jgi:DNA-binding MarR family transcriptional regulator
LSAEKQLSVTVNYGEVKVEFAGSPELVIRSLHEFVAKEIPYIDLARSISVSYSLNDLIQLFKDYIRFTPEGPRVWAQDKKFSDKDVIALQLTAERGSSLSGKSQSDTMTVAEIQAATGLNAKTISSRLSELAKLAYVERVDSEGVGKYKITTTGIHWLHGQLQKKFSK